MLTSLRIRNLGLVADLSLDLAPGYNVITGETGAGKSMLIGALSLVLGERADRSLIRTGAEACTVEAAFEVGPALRSRIDALLEQNGLEASAAGELIVKRSLFSSGSNRQFINGSPSTLSVLGLLGEWLVDIHGPHEHQSLLHPARQLAILDAFGELDQERSALSRLLSRRAALLAKKSELIIDEKTYAQQLDLLRYQVNEITAAQLVADEDQKVEEAYKRASNTTRILELCQSSAEVLADSETSVEAQVALLGRSLAELQRLDPGVSELVALHGQIVSLLSDLSVQLTRYSDRVEADPEKLQQLEERLNTLQSLKRKYGPTLEEVIHFAADAQAKLSGLEQRDVELDQLNRELVALQKDIWSAGILLSGKRRKLALPLSKAVSRELKDLGFAQSRFEIELTTVTEQEFLAKPDRAGAAGFDSVEFQFAPNSGEPFKPLRSIASSGELARVMLALKTVLAAQDQVPVLVFDEVDANVGGETGAVVGQKMARIANKRQVLCITHLPQAAASASTHFVAEKRVLDGRTVSEIRQLSPAERVAELARMLGGRTDAAVNHARAMLKAASA